MPGRTVNTIPWNYHCDRHGRENTQGKICGPRVLATRWCEEGRLVVIPNRIANTILGDCHGDRHGCENTQGKRRGPCVLAFEKGRLVVITRTAICAAAAVALVLVAPALAQDLKLPRQKIEFVAPPFVHPHEQAVKYGPKIMEFQLTPEEKQIVIDDEGTKLQAMTFNGSIPGPMMVVHEGDYVEVTLVNPETNSMQGNRVNSLVTSD